MNRSIILRRGTWNLSRLPLPPAGQRRRNIVAEIEKQFSRLDEAVANLKRVKAKLAVHQVAVLRAAVDGTLTIESNLGSPQQLNTGDPLPQGWTWRTVQELASPEPA